VLQASHRPPEPGDTAKTGEQSVRVGFTVTKKLGNAVIRNRIRRRLRAAADRVMPARAKKGYDYVVIGRAQTLSRSFSALMDDLETALQRTDACEGGDGARAS
jgi:ribonuclease P protein component